MATTKKNTFHGRYANYFKVGHNAFEFVVEFGQSYDEDENRRIHTRIVTSPVYAKRLLTTLQEAIMQHEAKFGSIVDEPPPGDLQ